MFENKSTSSYFTILNGKICRSVPAGTEGAIERVNKLGRVVHELFNDQFTGLLVGIRVTENPSYGKSWNFDFMSNGKEFTLQLSYSNSFAVALLKMLPNIDLSKVFTISPSVKMVEGKNQSTLFVNQDGKAIKHAYTRENPNGMPDMVQIKVKGVDTWDDTDRLAFLQEMVDTKIVPELKKHKVSVSSSTVDTSDFDMPESEPAHPEISEDDIPFD